MSEREWKPGDLAMVGERRGLRTAFGWVLEPNGGNWTDIHVREHGLPVRPLVVIDPEDVEQVQRLNSLYWSASPDTAMQAALREFADPKPRIEEPQGLGAVVEDDCGDLWVRVKGVQWVCGAARRPWSTFNAVRVLSEGVTK